MHFLLLLYCPICISLHPRSLKSLSHRLPSLFLPPRCRSFRALHFLLSLIILSLTVHLFLLPLSLALFSVLCSSLSLSLPSPIPFSLSVSLSRAHLLSPSPPHIPLVGVPVVDSTSARSRFANIARKRRRCRRLRPHP